MVEKGVVVTEVVVVVTVLAEVFQVVVAVLVAYQQESWEDKMEEVAMEEVACLVKVVV